MGIRDCDTMSLLFLVQEFESYVPNFSVVEFVTIRLKRSLTQLKSVLSGFQKVTRDFKSNPVGGRDIRFKADLLVQLTDNLIIHENFRHEVSCEKLSKKGTCRRGVGTGRFEFGNFERKVGCS